MCCFYTVTSILLCVSINVAETVRIPKSSRLDCIKIISSFGMIASIYSERVYLLHGEDFDYLNSAESCLSRIGTCKEIARLLYIDTNEIFIIMAITFSHPRNRLVNLVPHLFFLAFANREDRNYTNRCIECINNLLIESNHPLHKSVLYIGAFLFLFSDYSRYFIYLAESAGFRSLLFTLIKSIVSNTDTQ